MQDAGQESVDSNHRRAGDACNGIAWTIKKEEEQKEVLVDATLLMSSKKGKSFQWGVEYWTKDC